MDGRRITLTPGTTLRFGSLGFIYTGPVESVADRTFGRPPRPNVFTGAAAREAFIRGFSGDVIIGMLGPNPMQELLGSPPTTSLTSPSRPAETDRWAGGVHGAVHRNVPLWTARPPGRPGDDLH
jgi:hypothetical protein